MIDAAPELSLSIANILQAVTSAALIAGARMLWIVGQRLTAIETSLSDPDVGVKPAITSLRKSRHNDSNKLQEHETRLDGHDRDIERIDAQLSERRHPDQSAQPYGGRRATT